jgi:thioredoxin reductase
MYDLIIVGGGPAGLTAAIYALRKRLNAFLISRDLGGKTNYRMELPGSESHQVIRGAEVVEKFWHELDYLAFARHLEGVARIEREDGIFHVTTDGGRDHEARSVILATGSRVRRLGAPGEAEFAGKGLSYSALSYAPLFLGRQAAVIGDGPLALRATLELAQIAETVHLITLNGSALATPLLRRLATKLRVVVWEGYSVTSIEGDGYARQVNIKQDDGSVARLDVDGIFIELGLIPNSSLVADLAELDEEGRVVVDSLNRTSCPGLFAAGDVTTVFAEQVLIAVGEGAKAALSAFDYLLPEL